MKKTFDAPVKKFSAGSSSLADDIKFLEAQVRSLENECRAMRENLRDRFAMAAVPAIISNLSPENLERVGWVCAKETIAKDAYNIADAMLEVRKS